MREEVKRRILHNLLIEVTERYDQVMKENTAIFEKLSYEATHDALTGLYNRSYFIDVVKRALNKCTCSRCFCAVLFIDLDNFKVINDTVGHHFGDRLLKQIAKKLLDTVEDDYVVARFGGDEFVLFIERPGNTKEESVAYLDEIADKLLETINYTYSIQQKLYEVTASIGIALVEEDDIDINDILRHADSAMYEAKRRGKSCKVFFTPIIEERLQQRLRMETSLRRAIEHKEFFLVFQPQYDFQGKMVGAEALIRWKHPEYGVMLPNDFIPLAEETGLIVPIGEWLIDQACRTLLRWKSHPTFRKLKLSINCSAVEFMKDDYAKKVIEKIGVYDINSSSLTIEITESLLLMNNKALTGAMQTLYDFGVTLAIDDFGTGYSSLAYIKKFPIGILKIDQSFVKDVVDDPSDQTLVKAIVSVAKDFDMRIIAEGIETEEQLAVLRRLGGDKMISQGFLFGKPVELDRFEKTPPHFKRIFLG